MSRRGLLIGAAVAFAAVGPVVAWLRPAPVAAAVAPRDAQLARNVWCVGRACTPAPDYLSKRFCAQKHVTVLDAQHVRLEKLPCDEWHQP